MRKKLIFVVFSVMVILAIAVSPVYAITGDWQRDFEHPFVGLAVFYDSNGEFIWRCSGTLLDSTTFLTAGHCADTVGGAVTARIYFQQDAGAHFDPVTQVDPVTGYPETCAPGTLGVTCTTVAAGHIYNFGFTGALTIPNTHDAGLLKLTEPIELPEYGQLPEARVLDGLATARGIQNTIFTVSGYGLTYKNQLQNGKPNISFRERLMAEAKLVNVNSLLNAGFNLQTQGNGTGLGGTCNGDSGGPVFLGHTDSNLVVGITSFGLNALCRGADFAFRVDQPDVLAWIQSFMD
jgi:Secreted trypsin-like serine protease